MNINKYLTEPPKTRKECHEVYTEVCRRMESYYYDGKLTELMDMDMYRELESHLDKVSQYMISYGERKIGKMKYPPDYREKNLEDYTVYKCSGCKRHQEARRNLLLEPCSVCGDKWTIYTKKEKGEQCKI